MHKYKILLLGDKGVGKTTFIQRLKTGEFNKEPTVHTHNLHNVSLIQYSNYGPIIFDTIEMSTYLKLENVDGIILMFDVTSVESYENIRKWYNILSKDYDMNKMPFVICGNKVDVKTRRVKPRDIKLFDILSYDSYYDLSVKSNYHSNKPFLKLSRELIGHNLQYTETPALEPPEVRIDELPCNY